MIPKTHAIHRVETTAVDSRENLMQQIYRPTVFIAFFPLRKKRQFPTGINSRWILPRDLDAIAMSGVVISEWARS